MKRNCILSISTAIAFCVMTVACSEKSIDERAQKGDAEAQRMLAQIYETGDSLHSQSADSACMWYELAAFQGDSIALARIVPVLYEGVERPQDIEKCVQLAQIGDSIGEPVSQYVLSRCYESATGVERSMENTISYLEKSASKGFSPAMCRLAWHKMYEVGMPRDSVGAVALLEKCVYAGYPAAMLHLGHLYDYAIGVEKDCDKAKELYNKGIAMLEDQAAAGDHHALYNLGLVKFYGYGYTSCEHEASYTLYYEVEAKKKEAIKYFQPSADMGYAPAISFVAWLYYDGIGGVNKDYAKTMEYFQKAIDKNYSEGYYGMGVIYGNGNGVPRDYAKAMEYYLKASDKGHGGAMANIGYMYSMGNGVERDPVKKIEWYKKGAEHSNDLGSWNLFVSYDNGRGVARNKDLADKYEKKYSLCIQSRFLGGNFGTGVW